MSAKRRLASFSVLLTVLCAADAYSQTFNGAGEVLRDSLGAPIWRAGYRMNPTSYASLEQAAQTEVSARYAYRDSDGLNTPFEGDGGNRFRIGAAGYGVQRGKSIFSGAACFTTGTRRNTAWTDVCDVRMLYPYIVGDSKGGHYIDETYFLSGSYSRYFGRHTAGLRVEYTGRMAHRDRDPRPKNTVSDLVLNPGWSFRFGRGHTLGAFVKYRYYKQHVGISVEEPSRSYIFYLMRGMGLFDRMFSKGETSFSRYYFSDDVAAGVQWEKSGRNAFELAALFRYRKVRAEESDNRIPSIAKRTGAELYGAYRRTMGRSALTVTLSGEYAQQEGWERTYERITADEQTGVQVWRFLSQTLRDKIVLAAGNLRAEYRQGLSESLNLWYGLNAGYRTGEERFTSPQYHMRVGDIRFGADVGLRRKGVKGRVLETFLSAAHKTCAESSLAASADRNEIVVQNMLLPLYDYLTRDYTQIGARLGYTFPVKGFDLKAQADGGYAFGTDGTKKWGASLGLSVSL